MVWDGGFDYVSQENVKIDCYKCFSHVQCNHFDYFMWFPRAHPFLDLMLNPLTDLAKSVRKPWLCWVVGASSLTGRLAIKFTESTLSFPYSYCRY